MYCIKCGSRLIDNAEFCSMCGEKAVRGTEEAKPASSVFGDERQKAGYYGNEWAYNGSSPAPSSGFDSCYEPPAESPEKKRKRWLIPVIIAAAAAVVFLVLCFSGVIPVFGSKVSQEVTDYGNTLSNYVNYGYALETDDNIYYVDGEDWTLMIENKITGSVKETSVTGVDNLCFYDGYIYYRGSDGLIYRTDANGDSPYAVSTYDVGYFMIYEDWIYYLYTWSDGTTDLCRMDLDCENDYTILEDCGFYSFTISDGSIYYCDPEAGYNIYSTDIMGLYRFRENNADSELALPYEGYVYYINWDHGNRLYRMDRYSMESECFLDAEIMSYNICDGYIYYIEWGDDIDGGDLYRVPLSGGRAEKLAEGEFCKVSVAGEKVVAVDYHSFYPKVIDTDRIGMEGAAA